MQQRPRDVEVRAEDGRNVLLSTGSAWGDARFEADSVCIEIVEGEMKLERLSIPNASRIGCVQLDGVEIPFKVASDALEMNVQLRSGQRLVLK